MLGKLNSRKFWISIAAAVVLAVCQQFGVSPDSCDKIVEVVKTYLLTQGGVDAVKEFATGMAAKAARSRSPELTG